MYPFFMSNKEINNFNIIQVKYSIKTTSPLVKAFINAVSPFLLVA